MTAQSSIVPRERPTCSECGTSLPFPKDPPLPTPAGIDGREYSMFEMIEHEKANPTPRRSSYSPPAPKPIRKRKRK